MTKVVDTRRRTPCRHVETESRQQPSKYAADPLEPQPITSVGGEERRVVGEARRGRAAHGDVAMEHLSHARPEGHEAILTELCVANDEKTPAVDVAHVESASLAHTQAKAVERGENGVVGRPSEHETGKLRKPRRQLEKAARLPGAQGGRDSRRARPSRATAHG